MDDRIQYLIFGVILLFVSFASAAEINIDSANSIPAQTLWTVNINYELKSNDEAKLFLDNELLITVFEHDGKVFIDSTQNSAKVMNFNATNGELTLSVLGLSEGDYTLEAKVYSDDEVVADDSKEIDFYNWQDKIDSLESTVYSQEVVIKNLENDLNSKSLEIEKLKVNNQLTVESLKQINSSISTLQESDLDKNTSLARINADLNTLLEDKKLESGVTGFFSLVSSPGSIVALIGILLLIGIGVALYSYQKKKDSLY